MYWYDEAGNRFLTPEELAEQERQSTEQAEQKLQRLLDRLRQQGIDPETL